MDPVRSCIACRGQGNWRDLLHLVLRDNRVTPDPSHRLGGRGAWLHANCFEVAKNRRSFQRAFKTGENLDLNELENYLSNLLNSVHKEQK